MRTSSRFIFLLKPFIFLFFLRPSMAQVRPIIDNGFLSMQGWAGAIHPSGDYVIRADRSVIHAYDRKSHMLFQTYTSPCIATEIHFTADGRYMIVSTFGEIGESCNKTLVYDFYSGRLLFNERGRHLINHGPDNLFYFLQGHDENPGLPDTADIMLNIYDLSQPTGPKEQVPFTTSKTTDTITHLINTITGEQYTVYGKYTIDDIKAGKINSDVTDKKAIEYEVRENQQDLGLYYEPYVVSYEPILNLQQYQVMANGLVFISDGSNLDVYRIKTMEKVATIDSAILAGCHYLPEINKMVFKGSPDRAKVKVFDCSTFTSTMKELDPYTNHMMLVNDTLAYSVSVGNQRAEVTKYDPRTMFDHAEYTSIPLNVPEWELYDQGQYYAQVMPNRKMVLHNRCLLIDLNDYSQQTYLTTYDTNLVHPGVIRIDPSDLGRIGINEWTWNTTQAHQFEKQEFPQYTTRFATVPENELQPIKNADPLLKAYLVNSHYTFNFPTISNPFSQYTSMFDGTGPLTTVANPARQAFFLKSSILYHYHDSLLAMEYDTLLITGRKLNSKNVGLYEKQFRHFVSKFYSEDNLYRLNHQFPEFVLPYRNDNGSFTYRKPCDPSNANWYYDPVCRGTNANTRERSIMEKAFAASIIKPSLAFTPWGAPLYNISILNMEDIPNLGYAGIIPENDICFQDIVLPLSEKRQVLVNYAMGIFELQDKDGKTITRSSLYHNGDFIHVTPEGYYFASKNKLNRISIRKGNNVYPIGQFDLKYNRPDIVLQRLGCTDAATIESFHKAYLKRLKKMGFTEDMLQDELHLPDIRIENLQLLPAETDSSYIDLNLDMHDNLYLLDRINITINDVPVYGTNGIGLRSKNVHDLKENVRLNLCAGLNRISVNVLNTAGAKSYSMNLVVQQRSAPVKPDLYLVTIGDSKYADNRYDLSFAAKDASDIAEVLGKNASGIYAQVFSHTLTDENVTREKVEQLKTVLAKAKRNDVVIVTMAGHGVLDKEFNYYLATHDMDFSEPAQKGLPYEELESLLDGIAPLRKTILIDACHSGEVDKEEVEQLAVNTGENGNIKFRAAGAGIRQKNLGLKTTSELMNELFTDLRTGTGATVISSSSGVEYAMESAEWNNGLFTYCLLYGIKSMQADLNADGEIWLSEIQKYLNKRVSDLSKGRQKPTTRIENMNMDFRIW